MSHKKILVVDDEPSIREMLTIFLEEVGYRVATADSVAGGLQSLDSQRYDLVMCDLKLPDGSGLEVLEHARSRPNHPPFIIITAHTTPQHALEALRAEGFSEAMIDRFFRPFLGGAFLERELSTSSRMFEFVYRMFAQGPATLPARGMGAIPEQLAADLGPGKAGRRSTLRRSSGTTTLPCFSLPAART